MSDQNCKEDFFVSYAVRGPIVSPSYGIRAGVPVRFPIPGPVNQPSPLNSQYLLRDYKYVFRPVPYIRPVYSIVYKY